VTLRLVERGDDRVLYEGVAVTSGGEWPLRIAVALPDGRVTAEGAGAPEWLVELGAALVRAAFRATRSPSPVPFPRRLQRWRGGPGDADDA